MNADCAKLKGIISDIQRFSIHDGPGIRTTVFLKGCPLNCIWCHNPETISHKPQVAFYSNKCIGCGECAKACKNEAIIAEKTRIDRKKCIACGKCAEVCPPEAIEFIGQEMTAKEVLEKALRDLPFYKNSGGGITLSGGEPLYQPDFSLCLLKSAKDRGIHTAVETCGLVRYEVLEDASGCTDLFLYDIKLINPEKHRMYCGADNKLILDNAKLLASSGKNIIFRTPTIPGCNDSPNDIALLGEFMLSLSGNQQLQLMPYHGIGIGKYDAIGYRYKLRDVKAPESIDMYIETLADMGVNIIKG